MLLRSMVKKKKTDRPGLKSYMTIQAMFVISTFLPREIIYSKEDAGSPVLAL
jgi:hypothetical protein